MKRTDAIFDYVVGPKVLDIGYVGQFLRRGSTNWLHDKLINRNFDVWGIDISREDVERDIKEGYRNLFVMNAEDFDLPTKFNTIIAGEIIEHVNNPGNFLQNAFKHLEVGGQLIITTPQPFALLYILYAVYKFPKTCPTWEHTIWFCPQTFRELAQRYAFTEKTFKLLEDYEPNVRSKPYTLTIEFIKYFGFLLPKLLRYNNMLFVLEKSIIGV